MKGNCAILIFKKIRWKNFLSTGNSWTEIELHGVKDILIIGDNGSGKSTLLDALTFSIFGKPFRKINKPLLVNTVNGKDCVVEVEFSTNGNEYKISRGIKPNTFEIYMNGSVINQDPSVSDYQNYLESNILKMNYKAFTQVVIMGSASFTPFMKLSAGDRRQIIESLLDIQVFSSMNSIAKDRLTDCKNSIDGLSASLSSLEHKKDLLESNINSLMSASKKKLKDIDDKIDLYNKDISVLESEIEKHLDEISSIGEKEISPLRAKHSKLISLKSKIQSNFQLCKDELGFYHSNNSCPTCLQNIDLDFKSNKMESLNSKSKEYASGIKEISSKLDECIDLIDSVEKSNNNIKNIKLLVSEKRIKISSKRSAIKDYKEEQELIVNSDTLLKNNKRLLKDLNVEIKKKYDNKQALNDQKRYLEIAVSLLKDDGIKTSIIKQYLPTINKMINKYLLQMGFIVNFNLDENFEETIKSRYKDLFSYYNFSEGEKSRIDISILMAWRAIAKMRNSISTNLIIFDEIGDSSLDGDGLEAFMKIMQSLPNDSTTVVISHKTDQMVDKFSRVHKFQKSSNFSRIV